MVNFLRVISFLVILGWITSSIAQEVTTTTSTTQTTVAQNPNQNQNQMSLSQFEAWLQKNGYGQSPNQNQNPAATQTQNKVTMSAPTSSAPSAATAADDEVVESKSLTFEENQQVMVSSAPRSNIPSSPDSNTAFNTMMQQNMPLSPQQVVKLRQQIDIAQRAASVQPNIPPKPVSTTLMINLAPGPTPPAVRLAQGYVSSLVFVDSTGSPWPISSFDIGNPKALNIQWDGKSNILLMQAISPYSDGNMVVKLAGLPTPITLELVAGQRVVDYRVDIHVSGIGPNTKEMPLGTTLPNSANQLLLSVLDGIAPAGSKTLIVRGADAQAWMLGEKMYFRTRLTLLSPGWMGTMSSPDGMRAYELNKTSSVLVSRYGEPVELKIEGY